MTNYQKGRQLEQEVIQVFKKAGWSTIRGAASKGEFARFKTDIVATKDGQKYSKVVYCVLMQCKQITKEKRNEEAA